MRTEKEMFDLILNTARDDERIRAVVMNGSRANRSAKKDCFQDYDICYVVRDVEPFRDEKWIERFGEMMILQKPNLMGEITDHILEYVVYLMQFIDGTRIDLSIVTIKDYDDEGEPAVALLDKDGILPKFPEPTGEVYNVTPPTQKQFDDCCNEFWWINPYIAKGLWREELPYVKEHMEHYLRKEFMIMVNWYVGVKTDFAVSTGKMGKYLKNYLSAEEWKEFGATYPDFDEENIWNSMFIMDDMFRRIAYIVADHFGYSYPKDEDNKVTAFIKHVRHLPKNAQKIY